MYQAESLITFLSVPLSLCQANQSLTFVDVSLQLRELEAQFVVLCSFNNNHCAQLKQQARSCLCCSTQSAETITAESQLLPLPQSLIQFDLCCLLLYTYQLVVKRGTELEKVIFLCFFFCSLSYYIVLSLPFVCPPVKSQAISHHTKMFSSHRGLLQPDTKQSLFSGLYNRTTQFVYVIFPAHVPAGHKLN